VQLLVDVCCVNDLGEASQGGVAAEVELVEQHFEGALAVPMVVLGAGRVEAVCTVGAARASTWSRGT
jgi:hypothetical protein